MPRHVYCLIIDCDDESLMAPTLLEQVHGVIAERAWPEVRAHWTATVVPMVLDDRQQDPDRTTPELRLVDTG